MCISKVTLAMATLTMSIAICHDTTCTKLWHVCMYVCMYVVISYLYPI